MPDTDPLIITLAFDDAGQERFEALRRRHFPPARNLIPAHCTLFHHLPGEAEAEVRAVLERAAGATPVMRLMVAGLRFLGRGVAYDIAGVELLALRGALAKIWRETLTPQDRQSFRPHVTIQNKVDPVAARALFEELAAGLEPYEVEGRALRLWRYRGGPWDGAGTFPFRKAH